MRFLITIADKVTAYTTVEVEALTQEAAEKKALEMFDNGETDAAEIDWDSSETSPFTRSWSCKQHWGNTCPGGSEKRFGVCRTSARYGL